MPSPQRSVWQERAVTLLPRNGAERLQVLFLVAISFWAGFQVYELAKSPDIRSNIEFANLLIIGLAFFGNIALRKRYARRK